MRRGLPIGLAALMLAALWLILDRPDEKQAEAAEVSEAFEALVFWNRQRAYPNPDIPRQGLVRVFEEEQALNVARKSAAVPPWEPLGPHNIGGRTLALAINPENPSTIYAGAASGGLWRSYSGALGAQAWQRVPTGLPVLGVSAIAIAPDDTSTLYIGTGEVYWYQNIERGLAIRPTRGSYGLGILKSTDAGATWTKSLDWSYDQRRGVQMIRINPLNTRAVWAATSEGVLVSYDAGATWQTALDVIMATDVLLHPADTTIVFAAVGNLGSTGHGLYRSRDAGATWDKLDNGLPGEFNGKALLAAHPGDPDLIYASIGNGWWSGAGTWLARSVDDGDSWEIVSEDDYATFQGWFAHFVGIRPDDPQRLVIGGVNLWRSDDGGTTLVQGDRTNFNDPEPPIGQEIASSYIHPDLHAMAFHPENPDIVFIASDGGVFRSDDGGLTMVSANGGYQTVQFYKGFSNSHQDSLFAIGGLQDNGSILYTGTKRWRFINGADGNWSAIDPRNDATTYTSAQRLTLFRARGGDLAFDNISPPRRDQTGFIAPFVLAPSAPNILYAGSDIVFRSTNQGSNWLRTNNSLPLDGNPVLTLAVSPVNPDVVFAATAPVSSRARLFRTQNGGASWSDVTGSLPNRYLMDIALDPINTATVYVVASGYGSPHVFKSIDGGSTWQDAGAGLPDLPTSSVVLDPEFPQHVYVGNDLGVYFSKDGGQSWSLFSDGLPEAVIAMDLSISSTNHKLRLATHGNGAYERQLASVLDPPPVVEAFVLGQNFPNPFQDRTVIAFDVPEETPVRMTVYDVQGRHVATLVDQTMRAGNHRVVFENPGLASGVYICRMEAGSFSASRTMVVVR